MDEESRHHGGMGLCKSGAALLDAEAFVPSIFDFLNIYLEHAPNPYGHSSGITREGPVRLHFLPDDLPRGNNFSYFPDSMKYCYSLSPLLFFLENVDGNPGHSLYLRLLLHISHLNIYVSLEYLPIISHLYSKTQSLS